MGVVKKTPPTELMRQAAKVVLLGASNVSLSKFIEEITRFTEMCDEWEKSGESSFQDFSL